MSHPIFNIENRTENWLCAQHFVPLANSDKLNQFALQLIQNHQENTVENERNFNLELFWYGFRDFLHKNHITNLDEKITAYYNNNYSDLQSLIVNSKVLLNVESDNYKLTSGNFKKLFTNLKNTEIDIVIANNNYLLIGEAKHTQTFGSNGKNVLTHQLIRQYVMCSILAELIKQIDDFEHNIIVIPFIICNDKDEALKNNQVKFMLEQKWLNQNNILNWLDIIHLNK
nr:hypothetical protein [uncultured Tolumonas sp.]